MGTIDEIFIEKIEKQCEHYNDEYCFNGDLSCGNCIYGTDLVVRLIGGNDGNDWGIEGIVRFVGEWLKSKEDKEGKWWYK